MTDRPFSRRLPIWGAAVALVAAGCTSATAPTAPPDAPSSTTTTAAAAPATTAVAVDAPLLLESALASYAEGYRFSSVATVNGAEAGTVSGVVIGDESQMDVRSGNATVTYLTTPTEQWVRVEGGSWDLYSDTLPSTAPLTAFTDPSNLRIVDASDTQVVMTGIYPAAQFGGSDGNLELTMTFRDGLLVEASYQQDGDVPAEVRTSFSPLQTADEIEVPTP